MKNPVGNAKYIHQIGSSISSSMSWPRRRNKATASFPACRKINYPKIISEWTNSLSHSAALPSKNVGSRST